MQAQASPAKKQRLQSTTCPSSSAREEDQPRKLVMGEPHKRRRGRAFLCGWARAGCSRPQAPLSPQEILQPNPGRRGAET